MPNVNRLTVRIMAMVAEAERRMISKRTKDALAAAKRRGKKLAGPRCGADQESPRAGCGGPSGACGLSGRRYRADHQRPTGGPAPSHRAPLPGDRMMPAFLPREGPGGWSAFQVQRVLGRL